MAATERCETVPEITEIIKKYGDMLYRVCLLELKNEADAEDAVQETFIKYIKRPPLFCSDEHTKAWLVRVAVNQSRDIMRKRKIRACEDVEAFSDKLAADNDMNEYEGLVWQCLTMLPVKFSRVMILHFVEELDYKTISKITRQSESTVKRRIKEGRALFREIYEKEILK